MIDSEIKKFLDVQGLVAVENIFDTVVAPKIRQMHTLLNPKESIEETLKFVCSTLAQLDPIGFANSVPLSYMSLDNAKALLKNPKLYLNANGCDRLNALRMDMNQTCKELGIEPPLLLAYFTGNPKLVETQGFHIHCNNHTIFVCVNLYSPSMAHPTDAVFRIKHEVFHGYQRACESRRLLPGVQYPDEKIIEQWSQIPIPFSVDRMLYYKQPLERDADMFAYADIKREGYEITTTINERMKELSIALTPKEKTRMAEIREKLKSENPFLGGKH